MRRSDEKVWVEKLLSFLFLDQQPERKTKKRRNHTTEKPSINQIDEPESPVEGWKGLTLHLFWSVGCRKLSFLRSAHQPHHSCDRFGIYSLKTCWRGKSGKVGKIKKPRFPPLTANGLGSLPGEWHMVTLRAREKIKRSKIGTFDKRHLLSLFRVETVTRAVELSKGKCFPLVTCVFSAWDLWWLLWSETQKVVNSNLIRSVASSALPSSKL